MARAGRVPSGWWRMCMNDWGRRVYQAEGSAKDGKARISSARAKHLGRGLHRPPAAQLGPNINVEAAPGADRGAWGGRGVRGHALALHVVLHQRRHGLRRRPAPPCAVILPGLAPIAQATSLERGRVCWLPPNPSNLGQAPPTPTAAATCGLPNAAGAQQRRYSTQVRSPEPALNPAPTPPLPAPPGASSPCACSMYMHAAGACWAATVI